MVCSFRGHWLLSWPWSYGMAIFFFSFIFCSQPLWLWSYHGVCHVWKCSQSATFFPNKTMHVWSVSNNPLKGVMHCSPAVGIMSKREEEVNGLSRQRWDKTFPPPANTHSASNWTPWLWDNAIKPNGFVGNRGGWGKKRWHYEVIENNSEVKRWFKQR